MTTERRNTENLEDKIQEIGSAVEMLRNSPQGPIAFPVRGEFSNWRDEQEAWQKTAALLDQSYHMTDLYVEGPDTLRLLSDLGVNTFRTFGRNKAKQFVACNHEGFVIGDGILFGLEEDKVSIVGRPPISNWVEYNAVTASYDVRVEKDERSVVNWKQRKTYRFQVQGPNAIDVLEKINGGRLPDLRFFQMGEINIAGRRVRCLKHGMAGAPGLEVWGPYEDGEEVKAAIVEAGAGFGLLQAGSRAYSTIAMESGWLPSPTPAIYSGATLKAYREWLPADGFEGRASIGGSFVSENIEDYYQTPWDLGYGSLIKFDHDFVGRQALERRVEEPHRRKVTLSWNNEDVIGVFATMFQERRAKYMDMPASHYSILPFDTVVHEGRMVGLSTYPVYTSNGRRWISLAMVDPGHSRDGSEVTVIWGEPDGGTRKPVVERHVQTEIRATVGPCPFSDTARVSYRPYSLKW